MAKACGSWMKYGGQIVSADRKYAITRSRVTTFSPRGGRRLYTLLNLDTYNEAEFKSVAAAKRAACKGNR